jgi:uroporphyrinogen decarboxylase
MTSRERILTALDHRQPDRCPTFIWINGDALERLMSHVGVDTLADLEEELGIDRWHTTDVPGRAPLDYEERVARFVPDELRSRKDLSIGAEGTVRRTHAGINYLDDVVRYPLEDVASVAELREYPFPSPDLLGPVPDEIKRRVADIKATGAVVDGGVEQPFKTAFRLRGMENILCDFLVNPAIANEIYDICYDFNTARSLKLAEAGVDVITIVGDIAMQDRLIMSPDTWRAYDKPRLTRMIAAVKSAHPHVKIYMHSDGQMTDIVGDLVDAGLDILNPIQPECMDPLDIKKKWGDRLVLHGGISLQKTIPFGTADDVADEVRRLVRECGKGGGFVLGPANVFIVEFPVENIVTAYMTNKTL